MIKRTAVTLATLFAVTVARASDIAATFHFNPSLSHEANPLTTLFGAGPQALILTNIAGVLLLLLFPLYLFWRHPAKSLPAVPASLREYISLQLYNRVLPRMELLTGIMFGSPMPKDWLQTLRMCGIVVSWTVVFGSFLATFSWWAIWEWRWEGYRQIRALFSVGRYPVTEILCWGIFYYVALRAYFKAEYQALLRKEATAPSNASPRL